MNDDEDEHYNDYDEGYFPPSKYPWRELVTFILFLSIFLAGLWWLIWKLYEWV
jgi:hypothetical protein